MSDEATITTAAEIIPPSVQAVLDEHVHAIRECAERIRKRSLDELVEIGRHLAEVKKILGHGNFLPWLKREFGWSEDAAERYIALHALRRQIPHEQNLDLTITALAALGRSTTPPEAVQAIIDRVHAGEKPTVGEVKTTIKEARAAKPRLPSYIPTQETALKPIAPAPAPPLTGEPSGNARLGKAATAKSREHLQWFAVACREYLPHVTVDEHRQEARRLVAELTGAGGS
jgi:hypothetical protein